MLGLAASQDFSEMANIICQNGIRMHSDIARFFGRAATLCAGPAVFYIFFTVIRISNDSVLAVWVFWINNCDVWGVLWRWVLMALGPLSKFFCRLCCPLQKISAPPVWLNGFCELKWKRDRGKSFCIVGFDSVSVLRDEWLFPLVNLKFSL